MQLSIETGESLHQNKYIYKQIPPRLISSKPQFYLFQSHQHDKYIHYLIQKEDTKTDSKYSQFFLCLQYTINFSYLYEQMMSLQLYIEI